MSFLTETRKSQFDKAIFVFIENIIKYSDFINKYKNDVNSSNSNVYYKNLPFESGERLTNWLYYSVFLLIKLLKILVLVLVNV